MAVERFRIPSDGMNTEASPDYVPQSQCAHLENLIPYEGRLCMRGPIIKRYALGGSDSTAGFSAWSFENKLLMRTVDGHYVVNFPSSVTSITPTNTVPLTQLFDVHARVGDYVYGPVDAAAGHVGLGKWDPAANTITSVANAPQDFIDLKYHQNRLFVLGGSVPGTSTPALPLNLYWSDQGGPTSGTLAQWQDDASGLVNQIAYAVADTPVGLARCGRFLAILMRQSIYLLTGDTPSSYSVRLAVSDVGCTDVRSIAESTDGFYFMSERGLCYFDGASLRRMSDDVNTQLILQPQSSAYRTALLPGGYIAVARKMTSSPNRADLWISDASKPAWWLLSSDQFQTPTWTSLGQAGAPGIYRLSNYVAIFDGFDIFDGTWATQPSRFTTAGEQAMSDAGASPLKYIPAYYNTRVAKLAAPLDMATMKRVLVDYEFGTVADPINISGAVYRPTELANLTTFALPSDPLYVRRMRYQADVLGEVDAVQLKLSFHPGIAGTNYMRAFEVYDAYVEFDPAQPRPTL